MPRKASPPRLWKRPERRDKAGKITHAATWIILDGGRQISTGCGTDDVRGADEKFAEYLNNKHVADARKGSKPDHQIPVADVLTIYARDVLPEHSQPRGAAKSLKRLGTFFRNHYLSDINGGLCREYARKHTSQTTALVDLRYLRAAVNYHLNEGYRTSLIKVWTPADPAGRERWGTRQEVAALIRAAWRKKNSFGKPCMRHVARFILVGVYTGTRSATITSTALQREAGRPYIDTEIGVYHRRPEGDIETNKRRPSVPLPPGLMAHVRRWKRMGLRYVTERNGHPVSKIDPLFRELGEDTGIEDFTPHTLRHTCATWLMQSGRDPWKIAGLSWHEPQDAHQDLRTSPSSLSQ